MFNNRSIKALTSASMMIILVIMSFAVVSAAPAYEPDDQSTKDVASGWDATATTRCEAPSASLLLSLIHICQGRRIPR